MVDTLARIRTTWRQLWNDAWPPLPEDTAERWERELTAERGAVKGATGRDLLEGVRSLVQTWTDKYPPKFGPFRAAVELQVRDREQAAAASRARSRGAESGGCDLECDGGWVSVVALYNEAGNLTDVLAPEPGEHRGTCAVPCQCLRGQQMLALQERSGRSDMAALRRISVKACGLLREARGLGLR